MLLMSYWLLISDSQRQQQNSKAPSWVTELDVHWVHFAPHISQTHCSSFCPTVKKTRRQNMNLSHSIPNHSWAQGTSVWKIILANKCVGHEWLFLLPSHSASHSDTLTRTQGHEIQWKLWKWNHMWCDFSKLSGYVEMIEPWGNNFQIQS